MATNRRRRSTGIKKHVSSSKVSVSRGRSREPRVGRDGKAKVACPGCGAEYLVPGAALDNELGCKHCGTVFVPSTASRQRGAEQFNAKPYAIGGGMLLFVIIIYLATSGGETTQAEPKAPPPKVALTGMNNVRVRCANDWGEALCKSDRFNLNSLSDMAPLQTRFGITEPGDAGAAAVIDKLVTDESTNWFREFEITSAALEDNKQHEAQSGRVILYMSPRQEWTGRESGKPYWYSQYDKLQVALQYRIVGDRAKIGGFEAIGKLPKKRQLAKPAHKAHKDIGEAKTVKRTIGGVEVDVVEAEIKPLGHMEGISDELKAEIDKYITELAGENNRLAGRAQMSLGKIGKPAIPRLLNKMYETKMDSHENVLILRKVCGTLEDITGQRFGFNPSIIKRADGVSSDEGRLSALKQWYGYWTTHHDREDWNIAIEQEESLDFPGGKPPKPNRKN